MELTREKPGMVDKLNDLHKRAIGRATGKNHTVLFKQLAILVVEFVAMSVTLRDSFHPIGVPGSCSRHNAAGIGTETHGTSLIGHLLLLFQKRNNRVGVIRLELRRVSALQSQYVLGKLDASTLHTKTNAQKRDSVLPCVLNRTNLALNPTIIETTRNENGLRAREISLRPVFLDHFRLHPSHFDACMVGDSCVSERFVDRFVSVG